VFGSRNDSIHVLLMFVSKRCMRVYVIRIMLTEVSDLRGMYEGICAKDYVN